MPQIIGVAFLIVATMFSAVSMVQSADASVRYSPTETEYAVSGLYKEKTKSFKISPGHWIACVTQESAHAILVSLALEGPQMAGNTLYAAVREKSCMSVVNLLVDGKQIQTVHDFLSTVPHQMKDSTELGDMRIYTGVIGVIKMDIVDDDAETIVPGTWYIVVPPTRPHFPPIDGG